MHIGTEEVELDFVAPSPGGSSSKLSSTRTKGSGSGKIPVPPPQKSPDDSDSEFELNAHPVERRIRVEGTRRQRRGVAGRDAGLVRDVSERGGKSGINLRDAADSGISLEKPSDDSIDFELNLDESGALSSSKLPGSKPGKKLADSDRFRERFNFRIRYSTERNYASVLAHARRSEDRERCGLHPKVNRRRRSAAAVRTDGQQSSRPAPGRL